MTSLGKTYEIHKILCIKSGPWKRTGGWWHACLRKR